MSPSPLTEELPGPDEGDAYAEGWAALNKLLRRGFSWSGRERHAAFLNIGRGESFAETSRASGLDFPDDGRALASCDWDFDGDEDLFITNRTGPRLRFLENEVHASPPRFVLRPEDGLGRPLIGARVEVRSEQGGWVVRTLRAGEGYLAQSSRWLHFPAPGEVRVTWPGELEPEVFEVDEREGFYSLRKGTGRARPFEVQRVVLPDGPPLPAMARDPRTRVVLTAPVPLPRLSLTSSKGGEVELFGIEPGGRPRGTGRPVLLHLFAGWCAPCVRELTQLVEEQEVLESSGVAFLALGVETDAEERAATRALMERLEWPYAWGFASPAMAEVLDALAGILLDREQRLSLPTSFLVDAAGSLRVLYFGPVSAAELTRDRRWIEGEPDAPLAGASPFAGRWLEPPSRTTSLGWLEGRMRSRGLEEVAREYARGAIQLTESSPASVIHGFGRRAAAAGELERALGYFLQALEEDPDHFESNLDLAILLHRQGRLTDAVKAYAHALRLKPEHLDTHFNLGLAYVGLGDAEAARSEQRWLSQRDGERAALLEEQIEKMRPR